MDRFHDIITRFCKTTEQHNCLRTGECNEICQSLTKYSTCELKNLLCQFITLHCCIIYIFGSNVFCRNITQKAGIRACSQEFTSRTGYTCSRAIRLQTTFTSATAHTSRTATNNHMAQLTGKTIVTINHLSVNNNTATDTCAQCNHDKILHTTRSSIGHFTYTGRIGIISQSRRNAKTFFKHGSQRNNTFPRQVRSEFDCSAIIVSVRSTDTDTFYFFNATL